MKEKELFERLDRQNDILQQMLNIMPRPVNKVTRVLETIVLIGGTLSFITFADVIVKWVTGG